MNNYILFKQFSIFFQVILISWSSPIDILISPGERPMLICSSSGISEDVEAMNLRVDVTSGTQQASDQHLVICLDCFGPMKISTYPNPANDILNVTIEEAESIETETLKGKKMDGSLKNKNEYSGDIIYTLFNNYGQAVYNNRTNEKRIRINTSNIPDGIYILKIVLKDGIITKQVVIHK